MSDKKYPTALILDGPTGGELDFSERTCYRVDSAEHEIEIRAEHVRRVKETQAAKDRLFASARKSFFRI